MPLSPTGQISFADINVELGRGSTEQIGLNQAEAGNYGTINTNSSSRPNGSTPNSINEWRGYDHYAQSLTEYVGGGRGTTAQGACEDTVNSRTFYSNCNTLSPGCTIYVDTFPNALTGYDYVVINASTYNINSGNGQITSLSGEQC